MNAFDIHPEHLIDAVRRGNASAAQRAELEAHMRVCAVCAAEHRLATAFADEDRSAAVKSSGVSAAALDEMLKSLAHEGRVLVADHSWKRAAWLPWAAAACLFFTGSAAAATLIAVWRSDHQTAPSYASAVAVGAAGHRSASHEAREVLPPAPVSVAPEPNAHLAVEPVTTGAIKSSPHSSPQPKTMASAVELFEKARAAHLSGDAKLAIKRYRLLEQRYPSSLETHVSWVVLGRLYLEQLGDARTALTYFDRYLEKNGPNQPEALIGRARCLRALGRTQEEVQALRRLVERHPDSLYIAPAQAPSRDVR
jgi:TolA-binding protein